MNKKICLVVLSISIIAPSILRAEEDYAECAIWLCLPFGFMYPGCEVARKAMYKRIFEFKHPVPSWSSCSVGGPNDADMDMVFKKFAIVDDPYLGTVSVEGATCTEEWRGKEEHILPVSPWCRDTVKSVQITQDGVPTHEPFYIDEDYNEIEYDVDAIPPASGPLTKPQDPDNTEPPTIGPLTKPQDPRLCEVAVPPDWCRDRR